MRDTRRKESDGQRKINSIYYTVLSITLQALLSNKRASRTVGIAEDGKGPVTGLANGREDPTALKLEATS